MTLRRIPELFPAASYFDGEPQEWIINGLVPAGAITLLRAPPGAGKTKLAMTMARAVARSNYEVTPMFDQYVTAGEVAWLNLDRMPKPSLETLVLQLAQQEGLPEWANHIQFMEDDINMLGYVLEEDEDGHRRAVELGPDKYLPMIDYLLDLFKDYKLIIIDTWHKLMVNASMTEDSSDDTDQLMIPIRKLASTGAGVVLLHHTKKGELVSRGSSALDASVDHMMMIDGVAIGDGYLLSDKSRMDKQAMLPIEFHSDSTFSLNYEDPAEIGKPRGMWKAWIEQKRRIMSEEERRQIKAYTRFEKRIVRSGEKTGAGQYGMHRVTLLEIYKKTELDVILDHYRKVGKLKSTKGGTNPFYTLIVT